MDKHGIPECLQKFLSLPMPTSDYREMNRFHFFGDCWLNGQCQLNVVATCTLFQIFILKISSHTTARDLLLGFMLNSV